MENHPATDKMLCAIETNAQWDEHLAYFVRNHADVFIKHGLTLDTAVIIWQLNMLKNRIIEVENTLDEVIEAIEGT